MFKKFAIASVLSGFCAPAMACLPPPLGLEEWMRLEAIVSSTDVKTKLQGLPVTAIELLSGVDYVVTAGQCKLQVTVEGKRLNPSAPCGGPTTYVAVPATAINCLP